MKSFKITFLSLFVIIGVVILLISSFLIDSDERSFIAMTKDELLELKIVYLLEGAYKQIDLKTLKQADRDNVLLHVNMFQQLKSIAEQSLRDRYLRNNNDYWRINFEQCGLVKIPKETIITTITPMETK